MENFIGLVSNFNNFKLIKHFKLFFLIYKTFFDFIIFQDYNIYLLKYFLTENKTLKTY